MLLLPDIQAFLQNPIRSIFEFVFQLEARCRNQARIVRDGCGAWDVKWEINFSVSYIRKQPPQLGGSLLSVEQFNSSENLYFIDTFPYKRLCGQRGEIAHRRLFFVASIAQLVKLDLLFLTFFIRSAKVLFI